MRRENGDGIFNTLFPLGTPLEKGGTDALPLAEAKAVKNGNFAISDVFVDDIGTPRLRVQVLGLGNRRFGVVRQQRRDFQRNPTVDAAGSVINRPEQVRRLRDTNNAQLVGQFTDIVFDVAAGGGNY